MKWAAAVCLFLIAGGQSSALAQIVDTTGISRTLARDRAGRVSDIHYDLTYDLKPGEDIVSGEAQIRFALRRKSTVLLDFRGRVSGVQVNGEPSPVILDNGHLELFEGSLHAGENNVRIRFTTPVAAAGSAITRFIDRDDNSEYIYSLFVPMDASMAFPCFDQPDLKGRFKLTLTAPSAWTVISNERVETALPLDNTSEDDSPRTRTVFAETQPISTYLFAFAAGPFVRLQDGPGMPAVYARASVEGRAWPEAPRVQEITSRGISYFSDYFAQPFPFSKYDTVLIPGLAYSGMEHAGATFLREESVLFRTAPSKSDLVRRDVLVLHELAHQWFGDFVTMRWFDDLWLKEGFVQYMAYHALDAFAPSDQVWKRFYESTNPAAYAIDGTQGTTSIYQDIPNLADAKSAYGAIVYSKAPAVLRQLAYVLGDDVFREGLRGYLREHAFGSADWNDLVRALERASGAPLRPWADAWIRRRGMPQVDVEWACNGDQIGKLTLTQRGVLDSGDTWPMATQVLLDYGEQPPTRLTVRLNGRATNVAEAAGRHCPRFIFANDGNYGYGRFLLDERSRDEVTTRIATIQDPFLRAMLWGSLWESVRQSQLSPREYVALATRALPTETDEAVTRNVLANIAIALHRYSGDDARRALLPPIEWLAMGRMENAPSADLRIVWFRALLELAENPAALAQLKNLLSGDVSIPEVELRSVDRWNIVTALLAVNDPDAQAIFESERSFESGGEREKYVYAAEAARPEASTKSKYFDDFVSLESQPEDWIELSLLPFNHWSQSDLTAPFLKKALDALPDIKRDRKIFFLERWLDAFIGGQQSEAAQAVVRRALDADDLSKDLKLKIVKTLDELDRAVAIRRRFPDPTPAGASN